jgi:hypothetical protein
MNKNVMIKIFFILFVINNHAKIFEYEKECYFFFILLIFNWFHIM